MELRSFGRTGLEVSALGFGGAPVGFLETDRRGDVPISVEIRGAGVAG